MTLLTRQRNWTTYMRYNAQFRTAFFSVTQRYAWTRKCTMPYAAWYHTHAGWQMRFYPRCFHDFSKPR